MNLMQEQKEIQNALLYFWSCKACKRLGWDLQNGCPDNNKNCKMFLYNRIKQHFQEIYVAKWRNEAEVNE